MPDRIIKPVSPPNPLYLIFFGLIILGLIAVLVSVAQGTFLRGTVIYRYLFSWSGMALTLAITVALFAFFAGLATAVHAGTGWLDRPIPLKGRRRTGEIISALGDAVSIQDGNLRILFQNPRHRALTGDHAGEFCYSAYQRAERACRNCPVLMCFGDGEIHTVEKKVPERGMHVEITASPLRDSKGKIIAGIEIVRDISGRKRAEQEIDWYTRSMEKLLLMSQEITATTDLLKLYRKITSVARDVLGLDYSTVMILSPDRASLIVKDTIGFPESLREKFTLVEGQGLSTFVIKSRGPGVVPDFSTERRFEVPGIVYEHGISSALCVPMMIENEIFGVLIGHSREKRTFEKEEISLYRAIANHAAVAIKNSMHLQALHESEEKFRSIFETSKDVVYVCTKEGRFSEINRAGVELFGYSGEEFYDLYAESLYLNPEDHIPFVRNVLENGFVKDRELLLKSKNGRTIKALVTAVVRKRKGEVDSYSGTIRDVSIQKQMEETIRFQAYHDGLTGLPNRMLFNDRLSLAIAQAHRNRLKIGVLFLDLDRFKSVNDSLGHTFGDKLLQIVGERLRGSLREVDTIARMGGDEYTLLLPEIRHEEDVALTAAKILSLFSAPWSVDGHELHISSSIGISIYPNDGESPEVLLKNADLAMYHAKEQGRDNFQFYNPAMNVRALEKMVMENSLRHALQRGEFVVHYQPKIDLATRKISGLEALVRWNHPELGLLYPADFMSFAEESGLIVQLDQWVLHAACTQGRNWLEQGLPRTGIAVNLSARQIQQTDLVRTVQQILKNTGFSPDLLELEITEDVAMQNVETTIVKLRMLSGMGVVLSIDDFGSGYSSLTYLKKLPIQTIKIDKSFISEITSNEDDAAIISAVIAMSKSLQIKVVAEGVEYEEQMEFLANRGCDEIQGFLFGEAMPADRITPLVARGTV